MSSLGIVGGRSYNPTNRDTLDIIRLCKYLKVDTIVTGCCPSGVDLWARNFSMYKCFDLIVRRVGPVRNKRIIDSCGYLVVFPGGNGTSSSVHLAAEADHACTVVVAGVHVSFPSGRALSVVPSANQISLVDLLDKLSSSSGGGK